MTDLKILAWDIETRPHTVYRWGLFDQSPVGLNQVSDFGGVLSFAARWVGSPKKEIAFFSDHHDGHDNMIAAAWSLFDEADALLSWNGAGFDTKHMNREFLLAGLTPPSPTKEIDLMRAVKKRFRFPSNKLEHVAQALLGTGKQKHEGFDLWTKCLAGDEAAWKRMQKYNEQDVHLLIRLYDELLPWIDSHPNRNLYDGEGCPKCGSAQLQRRGTRKTLVGEYARFQCQACGGWSSSGKAIERVDIREDK